MGDGGAPAAKRNLLRDCCALSLLSLIPPDRVGCIRKLRLGHTLKKKPGGGWMMDLSKQRDGHKTSRFYGPFAASLPSAADSDHRQVRAALLARAGRRCCVPLPSASVWL